MLTPRLKLISEKIKGKKAADIGTDHAYIPIQLIKNGTCRSVIASDIKKGPADIAENNIKSEGLDIQVRLGSGLSVLTPGEVDDVIIAGMGGKLICSLLEEGAEVATSARLILQPMNGQYELRKYLTEHGYKIEEEDLAVEGFKVYNIIVCSECKDPIIYKEEIDFHIPLCLKEHKYYDLLKAKKIREFTKIIEGYKKSKSMDCSHRCKEIKKHLEFLKS